MMWRTIEQWYGDVTFSDSVFRGHRFDRLQLILYNYVTTPGKLFRLVYVITPLCFVAFLRVNVG